MAVALVAVLAGVSFAALPAGAAAATVPAGGLLAFGANYSGELGSATNNTTNVPNPTPAVATLPGQAGALTRLAGGADYSLAVTSTGQLYAFGDNTYGQLGIATNSGTSTPNPTPTPLALPHQVGAVTQVAAGDLHTLAVTASGQLYAFGYNKYGQLGNATGNNTNSANPTPILVGLPGQIGGVTSVAAGANHSLAATSSGQLYAFGYNREGELGNVINNGTLNPNPTPALVTLPGQIGAVTQLAAGASHSLALTSSGQLYAFGDNEFGELGNVSHNNTGAANPTPTLVTLPGQSGAVTQIAAGAFHSLVLTSSGQLYSFGYNDDGELGTLTNSGTTTPNPTPTLVGLSGQIGRVTQIAGGNEDSLVVTSSGQLYAFGLNQYGELGSATGNGTEDANPTPALVSLPEGVTIDTVARGSGALHTLALVSGLAIASGSLPAGQAGSPYTAAVSATGGAAPLTWSASGLPSGLSMNPASGVISGIPSAAGSPPATVTVTDEYGSETSRTFTLVIAPPSAPSPPPTLTVTHIIQSHRTWTERRRPGGSRRHAPPIGTTFSFTLNEAAAVNLAFTQRLTGRTVNTSCLAQTKTNRRRPACTRTIVAGTLTLAGRPGTNRLRFVGRISRTKKLEPGRYALVITAATGGRRSAPRSISFTIVK
jgi:alpha-tubulin suppressor-like RCC1 family protein